MIKIRTAVILPIVIFSVLGIGKSEEAKKGARIMTWVPPYAVEKCKNRLEESFDGVGAKDGLTHLGLQFWHPTRKGGVEFVKNPKSISDATVAGFRKWGDAHGVRIMLCVYNGTPAGWDWDLAKTAFGKHQKQLVEALVSETLRLKLDGVDIDFEGKGNLDGDQQAYVQFIIALSKRLHEHNKELTIDSFAYKWNAPNQKWWAELLPHVDGLHVMGYSEIGAASTDWRSYDFIKAAAGKHSSKILIGVPGYTAEWQDAPARKHLRWFQKNTSVGLAIWDSQLKAPEWRSKEMWQQIVKIKQGAGRGGVDQSVPAPGSKPGDHKKVRP